MKQQNNFAKSVSLFSGCSVIEKVNLTDLGRANFWIKRDDKLSFLSGGCKVRMAEYFLSKALETHASTIITIGSVYSNQVSIIATAAAVLGLKSVSIIVSKNPNQAAKCSHNNLLIAQKNSSKIVFTTPNTAKKMIEKQTKEAVDSGQKPFFIPGGGYDPLGVFMGIEIVNEIISDNKLSPGYIFLPVGTGTLYTGVLIGTILAGIDTQVVGISISKKAEQCQEKIADLYQGFREKYEKQLTQKLRITVSDKYIGGGYGKTDTQSMRAIGKIIKRTGIIFDPVYSGKAFLGAVDYINNHTIVTDCLFIHSGGDPIYFEHLLKYIK